MKSIEEIESVLNHAAGTIYYYVLNNICRTPGGEYIKITDGVKWLATAAECFWLLDIIASYQKNRKLDQEFQVWKFETLPQEKQRYYNCMAEMQGYNDTDLVIRQKIPFTDFPLETLKLYYIRGVILLPSEY